jgi:hypothetical protein
VHAEATAIDPVTQTVTTTSGRYFYDYLVIASGYRNNFDAVPGLGPDGHAQPITTLADAERAAVAWTKFLDGPGPGGDRRGPGGELLRRGVRVPVQHLSPAARAKQGRVPLTFVHAEPFLGHFGIGGLPASEKLLTMFLHQGGHHTYQSEAYPEIYAVGIAAQVPVPWHTAVPIGVPKTGFPSSPWPRSPPATSPRRSRASHRAAIRSSVKWPRSA